MNTKQENRLNMYLAVKVFLLSKLAVLGTLPNFSSFFGLFQEIIAAIQKGIELQSFNKTGETRSKKELKQILATRAGDNSRKLYAYALSINDHVLATEMNLAQSKLEIKSDSRLAETSEGIYNRATLHLAELAAYGITAATQLELRNAIDNFATSMPKPRLNDTYLKRITQQMADNFTGADKSIKQIDAIIEIIRYSDPDLYESYKLARKTMGYGASSIAMNGLVVDEATKTPIKGVTITITVADDPAAQPVIVKKSAAKGGFNVKSLPEGIYQLKHTKPGYNEKVTTVTVNNGELCKSTVEMNKIGGIHS